MELLWSTYIRRGEVEKLDTWSADFTRRMLTIVQGKGKSEHAVAVAERALWGLARYLHHVWPEVLVTPDCKALFLSGGPYGGRHHDGRVAVSEIRRHRQSKLSPVPACDGDADAGERG